MDPMSGILGLGTSLVGGIMGADAATQAANTNWQINELNFMQSEQERQQRLQEEFYAAAERNRQEQQQQEGTTDAQGNHTYFDPNRGWVTSLSYQGQQSQDQANSMRDAQYQERMQELSKDVPLQRAQMEKAYDQNVSAGDQADAFARMLHTAILSGPEKNLGGDLYAAQAQGINDAYDRTQSEATREALRQGTPNMGAALSALAQQRSKDLSAASSQDWIQGREQAKQDYNNKISNLVGLLNAFTSASRSPLQSPGFNPVSTDYSPQSSGLASPQVSANSQLQLNDGDQQIADAFGQKGGRLDYVQPNYGMANTLASMGGQLSNLGKGSSASAGGGGLGGLGSMFSGIGNGISSGMNNLSNAFMTNSGVF